MIRRIAILFWVTQALGGCSFAVVSGPPSNHRKLPSFNCNSGSPIAVVDTLLAIIWASVFVSIASDAEFGDKSSALELTGFVATLHGVGAYYGFSRSSACENAREELAMRYPKSVPISIPAPLPASMPSATPRSLKPKIAVLGLEIVVSGTKADPTDLLAASLLTDALRMIPKSGAGTFDFAPNSTRELLDEKLAGNCDTELPKCMAPISIGLGADYLIYGNIAKISELGKDGYRVTLKILDVHTNPPRLGPTLESFVLLNHFTGAPDAAKMATEWAQDIYARLIRGMQPIQAPASPSDQAHH